MKGVNDTSEKLEIAFQIISDW